MPAWSDIVKAQSKEELNELKYQRTVIDSAIKRKELDIKDRLSKIDYLEKIGVDAGRVLGNTDNEPLPQEPMGGQNQVQTPTNTPYQQETAPFIS